MLAPVGSVLDVLRSDGEHSFLVELIDIAGLTHLFQQQLHESSPSSSSSSSSSSAAAASSLTFFAPTNQASPCYLRQVNQVITYLYL